MWRECKHCGEKLTFPKRYDAQYCGASCRKKAERRRKANSAQELYNHALPVISKFSKLSGDEISQGIASLKLLKQAIDEQLRALGDADELARLKMFEDMRRKRGL